MLNWFRPPIGFGQQYKSSDSNRQWQQALDHLCALPGTDGTGKRVRLPAEQFVSIAQVLKNVDKFHGRAESKQAWFKRPRLYTVLKSINALDCMETFTEEDRYDIELPYDAQTMPAIISSPTQRAMLLQNQECVLTDALKLESPDQHIHFGKSDKDQFISMRELGKGGYGSVDEVLSKLSWRVFARKRARRGSDILQGRRVQKAMIDEINIAKKFSHRHLIKIVGSYTDQDYIAFLMEPVAECNLAKYLKRASTEHGREHTLRQFFGCLTGAIDYLHHSEIRHRDLKPQNILVKEGQVYIADFGNAMDWSSNKRSTTQDRHGAATPFYMAPEVYERAPRNTASDMFSLGIVFLEIMTVLKGSTVAKWEDTIVRKAQREKKEAYPCLHLDAISAWLVHLGNIGTEPEFNEPLIWIKELLRAKSEERVTASRLVQMIVESPFAREHCCMDCFHSYQTTDYTTYDFTGFSGTWGAQLGEDGKLSQELAQRWGLTEPEPQVQDQRSLTIQSWLDTSQPDLPFNVHESISLVLDSNDRDAAQNYATSLFVGPDRPSKTEFSKPDSRDGEHAELDDVEQMIDTGNIEHDDLPFNVIEDGSSDVSNGVAADDLYAIEPFAGMSAIVEEDEYDTTPGAWPREDSTPKQRHDSKHQLNGTAEVKQWFVEQLAELNSIDEQLDSKKVKSAKKKFATTPADESSSKAPRLSAKNISKLNASNAPAPKLIEPPTPINTVLDASKYIDDAWKQAEAAVSVATTAVSEKSAKMFNISGAYLRWQDRDMGLMEAYCKAGKSAYLRKLLEKGCNPGTVAHPRTSPLILAIQGRSLRHVKCVKALISKGCHVNGRRGGKTPIHRLIDGGDFQGFHKLLVMLLMAGADVHAVDMAGDSVLSRLFSGSDMNAPLEEWRNMALALMLNDKIPISPDINATESTTNNSLVHLAIKRKSPRTLALLIHKNAKVNVKNTANITPLVMAANQWLGATTPIQQQMLDALLKAKDVDINGFGGSPRRTPLHCAIVAGCPHATRVLIASGADVSLVDGDGKTALTLLKKTTHPPEVKQEIETIFKNAQETAPAANVVIPEKEKKMPGLARRDELIEQLRRTHSISNR